MAFFSDTTADAHRPAFLAAFAARLADLLFMMAKAHDRTDAVQQMQALTDRQLADIGVPRDDIVRHVYRDIYYL